jgi:hypothetical protein
MNSEPWRDPLQKLWQRQPVPATVPMRTEDRILRDAQTAEAEWERESSGAEWVCVIGALLMGGPELLQLAFGTTFDWASLCLNLMFWWWAAVAMAFRWRRQRIDRAFQHTLVDRIARGRRLLRERIVFNDVSNLIVPVLLALAVGLTLLDMTDGSMAVAMLGGSVTFALLAWLFVIQRRSVQAHLARRLAVLDDMRTELAMLSPADQP